MEIQYYVKSAPVLGLRKEPKEKKIRVMVEPYVITDKWV